MGRSSPLLNDLVWYDSQHAHREDRYVTLVFMHAH